MSDFEKEEQAEDLQHKFILLGIKMNQIEREICDYMCDYLGPYYKDASTLEKLQVGLDIAEDIRAQSIYLHSLTADQMMTKRLSAPHEIKGKEEWFYEEFYHRILMVVENINQDPTLEEAIYSHLFCHLPILEPLNED